MIWNGKRAAGVQVYVGKQSGLCKGEYAVIYFCNGSRGGLVDGVSGLREGDIWPAIGGSFSLDYLKENYRRISYRQLSEEARGELGRFVI